MMYNMYMHVPHVGPEEEGTRFSVWHFSGVIIIIIIIIIIIGVLQ